MPVRWPASGGQTSLQECSGCGGSLCLLALSIPLTFVILEAIPANIIQLFASMPVLL